MNELIFHLLISAAGGGSGAILRVLVFIKKAKKLDKPLARPGLLLYTLTALVIGIFSGIMLDYGIAGSFLAGYAGMDLMKGYRTAFKKTKIKVTEK